MERHVGSFCALLSLLGRVLLVSGGSSSPVCHFFTFRDAPASILTGSGTVWGRFWRLRHLIFRCFFVHVGLTCVNAPTLTKRWQEQQKSRFFIYVKLCAQGQKLQKTGIRAFRTEIPAKILSKTGLWARRARFWEGLALSSVSFGQLLGGLRRTLGPLGRFLGALGHVLGPLGHLLAGLWRSLGVFWTPRASILAGFEKHQARFWRPFGTCVACILLCLALCYLMFLVMQ